MRWKKKAHIYGLCISFACSLSIAGCAQYDDTAMVTPWQGERELGLFAALEQISSGAAEQALFAPEDNDLPQEIKDAALETRYGQDPEETITVPPLDWSKFPKKFQRRVIYFPSTEEPGTIIVDQAHNYLYFIAGNNEAIRYGVAVGSEGRSFKGVTFLQMKRKWPKWTPTKEMIERIPEYARFTDGIEGGVDNPLGARAMYLFQDGVDTHYRIHGTNKPASVGQKVSSGCIRMYNPDVVDLYARVKQGAKVIVK